MDESSMRHRFFLKSLSSPLDFLEVCHICCCSILQFLPDHPSCSQVRWPQVSSRRLVRSLATLSLGFRVPDGPSKVAPSFLGLLTWEHLGTSMGKRIRLKGPTVLRSVSWFGRQVSAIPMLSFAAVGAKVRLGDQLCAVSVISSIVHTLSQHSCSYPH